MESIGFIGLGAMGRPMASNLLKQGFALHVYDTRESAMQALIALGAQACHSVAELTRQVDIIITMLPNSADVESVVLGADGVLANARENAQDDLLLIDMSTIAPASTDKLASALGEAGVAFVDAPVGRTVAFAERGESLFMVGASHNDMGRVKPILEGMGTVIHHCGQPGSGIRTKLINNFIAIAVCQINAEAFALAQKFGLDPAQTLAVVTGTTATNGHLTTAWPAKVFAGDIEPGFRIDLARKDLALALDAARQANVALPTGAAACESLSLACNIDDFASKDFSALLDVACQLAQTDLIRL